MFQENGAMASTDGADLAKIRSEVEVWFNITSTHKSCILTK